MSNKELLTISVKCHTKFRGAFKVTICIMYNNDYGGHHLNSHDRDDANVDDDNHKDNPVCGDLDNDNHDNDDFDDANNDNTNHDNDKLDD